MAKQSSALDTIKTALNRVQMQLRVRDSVEWSVPALAIGLLLTAALIWAGRFYPLTLPMWLLTAGLILTALLVLIAVAYALLRSHPALMLARLLDRHLNLDDRLSTTLELAQRNETIPPEIVQAQRRDTVRHLRDFDATEVVPIRWPWQWLVTATLLVVLITTGMALPNPQVAALQSRARDQEVVEKQKEQLEEIRADLLEDEQFLETPQSEEVIQTLDELIQELETQDLTPEEALAEISEAEQELAELQSSAEAQQEAALNDVAESFSQFESTQQLAEAIEQRDMTQAQEALQSAGQQAAENPETAEELADSLEQAAQQAAENGNTELAESLQQAADALNEAAQQQQSGEGGDPQAMEQAMQQAAEALEQAAGDPANQQAMEEALSNIQEAREQLAEAGGDQSSGSPGQQAEAIPSEGEGAGEGEGGNVGGAGDEDPSGEAAEGMTSENAAPNAMSTDNEPQGNVGEYEQIYAPEHLGGEGGPLVNPEEQGATGGVPIGDAPVDPNQPPGEALVPYNEVYGDYENAASEALDDSYIPLGMKGYIRNYFGALEPQSGQ